MDIAAGKPTEAGGDEIDRPTPSASSNRVWGSDAIAAAIRELDIPYVALNPGSSYRGLHDSLVNHLGNTRPRMLLCLHEESAVALAHGWAKVTGRPLLVIVHANVGLMHATMAIFNAWCDRVPVIVLGATGALDATRRRPWIEWIHTARDQGALIRNFIKWDDQPSSIGAAQEAVLRANMIAQTAPHGPVYLNFDLALQEDEIDTVPPMPDLARFLPPAAPEPGGALLRQAAELLARAERPVILMGRASRDPHAWAAAGGVGRGGGREGHDRPQGRRRVPDRPSAACRRPGHGADARRRRAGRRRRRDLEPRLDRPRRHLEGRRARPAAHRQGHPDFGRPVCPQWLEHGLPGPAAGRRLPVGRARRRGAAAAGRGQGIAPEPHRRSRRRARGARRRRSRRSTPPRSSRCRCWRRR